MKKMYVLLTVLLHNFSFLIILNLIHFPYTPSSYPLKIHEHVWKSFLLKRIIHRLHTYFLSFRIYDLLKLRI